MVVGIIAGIGYATTAMLADKTVGVLDWRAVAQVQPAVAAAFAATAERARAKPGRGSFRLPSRCSPLRARSACCSC